MLAFGRGCSWDGGTRGLIGAVEAADAMVKAANVISSVRNTSARARDRAGSRRRRGVKAATDAGAPPRRSAADLRHVIPRPHAESKVPSAEGTSRARPRPRRTAICLHRRGAISARRAKTAAPVLMEFSQEQIDAIADAIMPPSPHAGARPPRPRETGYGVVAARSRRTLLRPRRSTVHPADETVGVIRASDRKVIEIAGRSASSAPSCRLPTRRPRRLQDPHFASAARRDQLRTRQRSAVSRGSRRLWKRPGAGAPESIAA